MCIILDEIKLDKASVKNHKKRITFNGKYKSVLTLLSMLYLPLQYVRLNLGHPVYNSTVS